jgi:hypothetical protein
MIKWIWQLLFKAKRLSFKNGDIFVFKIAKNINRKQIDILYDIAKKILNNVGCKDSEILFLTNDMDVFILDNNNQIKS